MQVATVGAVGIPWIGDLNGDSYPEIFVPQGNKLHIYAYGKCLFGCYKNLFMPYVYLMGILPENICTLRK